MVCTVHQLWDGFLADLPVGSHPFEGITADCARKRLRIQLEKLRGKPRSLARTIFGVAMRRQEHVVQACCFIRCVHFGRT